MNKIKQINLGLSGIMVGLIWVIQLVHYPSFKYVDPLQFSLFHENHTFYMGIIAAPLMILELTLSTILAYKYKIYIWPFLIVLVIWVSTFCIQVPFHAQLEESMSLDVIGKLIDSNWLRTVLWTTKAFILTLIIQHK